MAFPPFPAAASKSTRRHARRAVPASAPIAPASAALPYGGYARSPRETGPPAQKSCARPRRLFPRGNVRGLFQGAEYPSICPTTRIACSAASGSHFPAIRSKPFSRPPQWPYHSIVRNICQQTRLSQIHHLFGPCGPIFFHLTVLEALAVGPGCLPCAFHRQFLKRSPV